MGDRDFKQAKRSKDNTFGDKKKSQHDRKDVERKAKKRKAPDSSDLSEQTPSKIRHEGFTETDFKVMLRDPETVISGLEQFIEAAEKCVPGNKDYDTVEGFCRSSSDASEICQLLEGENRKSQEYQLIFQCLEKILLRIASDLPQYTSVGIRIVKRLFPMHTGKVYFTLNEKNKSFMLKTTLKLLTAVVVVKDVTAQWLLNHFDLGHSTLKPLFSRRDTLDDEDVRTCAVHFILAFLLTEKNEIILQVMEKQGVLGYILEGILYDRVATIQIVLSTLVDKVVKNETVSRSMKLRMFAGWVLRQLANLYNWKGPSRWKESLKNSFFKGQKRKKKKTQENMETEEYTEDKQQVCELVHDFLVELCTSHKHGLFFSTRGQARSRICNMSLGKLLEYLSTMCQQLLVQDLVVKILRLCPDQVPGFVNKISHMLAPRPAPNWVSTVTFLCKIYDSLPLQSMLDQYDGHKSLTELTSPLLQHTVPPAQILDMVRDGLKEKGMAINYVTLGIVRQVGECVVRAQDLARQSCRNAGYTEGDITDILNLYTDTVIKALPHAHTMFQFWDKVQVQLTDKADQKELQQLKELAQTDVVGVLVRMEQVLCLYQTLNPALLINNSYALGKLLEGILNTSLSTTVEDSSSTHLPKMYLLKLLAGTDAGRLPFSKQNASHHSLLYQLLEMVPSACDDPKVKHLTPHLICQLLENTGSFESCYEELMVWLGNLQIYGHKTYTSSPVVEFVAKVILRYMSNPFQYMDKVCDLVSEVTVMETKRGQTSAAALGNKIKDISDEYLKDLDAEEETGDISKDPRDPDKRFPFCPLLLVAIETLEKMEDIHQDVTAYMSSVLLDVFHQQVDPVPLCTLAARSFPSEKFIPGVTEYLQLWLPEKKSKKSKPRSIVGDDSLLQTESQLSALYTNLGRQEDGNQALIQQYLTHTGYLISHKDGINLKEHLHRLAESIEGVLQKMWESQDESGLEDIGDFSLLDIQKETKKQQLTKAIQLVLNDPRVRNFYYKEIFEKDVIKSIKTVAHSLTKLATSMLKLGQKYDLELGTSTEYYQSRLLACLQHVTEVQEGYQYLKHVYHGLKAVAVGIDDDQCLHMLENVLHLSAILAESQSSYSVCAITNNLLNKMIAGQSTNIKLSKASIEHLIRCYINQTESDSYVLLEQLFVKFPNLLVLVDTETVGDILQSTLTAGLLSVLITNNVNVRERFGELVLHSDDRMDPDGHLPVVLTYLQMICNDELEQKHEIIQKIVHVYKKKLQSVCQTDTSDNSEDLVRLCRQLRRLGALGHKLHKKMEQLLLTTLASADTVDPHHVDLLQQLVVDDLIDTDKATESRQRLLIICVQTLARVLKKREKGHETTENKLFDILATFAHADMNGLVAITETWPKFLKYSLKHYYTDPRVLKFLAGAIPVMYSGDTDSLSITMETVVTMVMSHSSYFSVMFNEESEACKDALLDILLVLIKGCPSVCDKEQIGILLGAYGATLSCTDQKILQLLQMYEKNGVPFIEFKPFLWGSKAIEYQQMAKQGQQTLYHRQPGMKQVITSLDPDRMRATILNFPAHRKLQTVTMEPTDSLGTSPDCYDPCFLLPLLSHLLSSESVVQCKTFIDWDCLSFSLVALSSHDDMMRMAAYHVLDKFRTHLEGTILARKDQVLHVLGLLHNSVGKSKLRLASIASMFLARTVKLIFKPGTHMYGIINASLMHKPNLDMEDVPEFYKLFQSSVWEYRTERLWILTLLHDGLKDKGDYEIFEKKQIFKLLQGFCESNMADTDCKLKVLQILLRACRVPDIALDLVRHHNFLTWISLISTQLSADCDSQVELLVSIVSSIWKSLVHEGNMVKPKISAQVLTTLQSLLWITRRCSVDCLFQFVTTLLSVVQHMSTYTSRHAGTSESPPTLTWADMLVLLYHARRFIPARLGPGSILAALTALGYSTSVLEAAKGDHSNHTRFEQDVEEEMETKSDKSKDKNETSESTRDNEKLDDEENEKDTDTETSKDKDVVTDLSNVLIELMLTVKTDTSVDSIEITSAVMAQITWVVGQLGQAGDTKNLKGPLLWMNELIVKQTSSLLTEALASQSDLSSYIVTSLLNTYTCVFESRRKDSVNDGETNFGRECLNCLNHILMSVASHYFSGNKSKLKLIAACQSESTETGNALDKQSVTLRQLFVTQSVSMEEPTQLLKKRV